MGATLTVTVPGSLGSALVLDPLMDKATPPQCGKVLAQMAASLYLSEVMEGLFLGTPGILPQPCGCNDSGVFF